MIIYPAIDLKNGKCVRLYKGNMAQDTVYSDDPVAQAKEWEASGFRWLHIVDLDGAVKGMPANSRAVRDIIKAVDIPVQVGGGIRSMPQISHWLKAGVSRIILGTAAVSEPELVKKACEQYPGKIAVGIDARGGKVAVEGWTKDSSVTVAELVTMLNDVGVAAIIHTDIDRDGTGKGVNIDATKTLAASTKIPVIASGGVASVEDIRAVKEAGLEGVIVGRAFYDKTLDPKDALAAAA